MKISKLFWIVCLFATILASSPGSAEAASLVQRRAGFQLGAWRGKFVQAGYGARTENQGPLGHAFQAQFGLFFNRAMYLEYNFAHFSTFVRGADPRNVAYTSGFGANLGMEIPILPLETFVGYESSGYNFDQIKLSGYTIKAGAGLTLLRVNNWVLRARAEYRWQYIDSDNAGKIPSAYTTKTTVLFGGLSLSFTPPK